MTSRPACGTCPHFVPLCAEACTETGFDAECALLPPTPLAIARLPCSAESDQPHGWLEMSRRPLVDTDTAGCSSHPAMAAWLSSAHADLPAAGSDDGVYQWAGLNAGTIEVIAASEDEARRQALSLLRRKRVTERANYSAGDCDFDLCEVLARKPQVTFAAPAP